jgi:DNA glycosylase AlkZ-like
MRSITTEERLARLAHRHHLAAEARTDDAVAVAGDLAGLHSTDPTTVYLSLRARTRSLDPADIDRALYDERALLRMIGMRRTLFVLPLELVPVVQAACTRAVAGSQRRTYAKLIEQAGIADDGLAWLATAAEAAEAALAARGEALAAELSADVPMLRAKVRYGDGKKWAGSQGMTSWVLFLLSADGRVVRGRPRGAWTGSQWRWTRASSWLAAPLLPSLEPDEARVELARRWLRSFGPATVPDLKWWTGWTMTQTRAALNAAGAVELDLDGTPGVALPDELEPSPAPRPWAALLPALDPTVMGWKERSWYLGDHGPALFDRAGNAGPTVWWNGRVVGGWLQRRDGEIVLRLLEDIGADARAAIDEEAARLAAWLGDTVVTPRFRTPLERELAR